MRIEITINGWQFGLYILDTYFQYMRILFLRIAKEKGNNLTYGQIGFWKWSLKF